LLHKDHTPKPAYNALLQLVKGDWWLAPTRLTTDASGQFSFSGFLGDYEFTLGNQKIIFSLKEKGEVHVSINL
jgi:endo-1,4-beta-xylanase